MGGRTCSNRGRPCAGGARAGPGGRERLPLDRGSGVQTGSAAGAPSPARAAAGRQPVTANPETAPQGIPDGPGVIPEPKCKCWVHVRKPEFGLYQRIPDCWNANKPTSGSPRGPPNSRQESSGTAPRVPRKKEKNKKRVSYIWWTVGGPILHSFWVPRSPSRDGPRRDGRHFFFFSFLPLMTYVPRKRPPAPPRAQPPPRCWWCQGRRSGPAGEIARPRCSFGFGSASAPVRTVPSVAPPHLLGASPD